MKIEEQEPLGSDFYEVNRFVILRKAFPIGIDEYKEELSDNQYVHLALLHDFMEAWKNERLLFEKSTTWKKEKRIKFIFQVMPHTIFCALCDGADMKIGDIVKFTNIKNGEVSLE